MTEEVSWYVGNFRVIDGPTSGEGLLPVSFHGRKEREQKWEIKDGQSHPFNRSPLSSRRWKKDRLMFSEGTTVRIPALIRSSAHSKLYFQALLHQRLSLYCLLCVVCIQAIALLLLDILVTCMRWLLKSQWKLLAYVIMVAILAVGKWFRMTHDL